MALGGDFRISTPDAIISIMESRWGLIADMGGTLALKELLTLDKAKELAMTGEVIDDTTALNTIGYVHLNCVCIANILFSFGLS